MEKSKVRILAKIVDVVFKFMKVDCFIMLGAGLFYSILPAVSMKLNMALFDYATRIYNGNGTMYKFLMLAGGYAAVLLLIRTNTFLYQRYFLQYGSLNRFEKKMRYLLHDHCGKLNDDDFGRNGISQKIFEAKYASTNVYRTVQIIAEFFCLIIGSILLGAEMSKINNVFIFLVAVAALPALAEKMVELGYAEKNREYIVSEKRKRKAFEDAVLCSDAFKETRACGAYSTIEKKWENTAEKIIYIEEETDRKMRIMRVMASTGSYIGTAGGFLVSALFFIKGKISIGEFSGTVAAFMYINSNVYNFFSLWGDFTMFVTMSIPFFDMLEMPVKYRSDDEYTFNDSIQIKDLSYRYENRTESVLKNISLNIRKGEKIAFVGLNGSGKTTLMKILLRLLEVDEGVLLYDGIEVSDTMDDIFYKDKSALFQEFCRYPFSIAENICFSDKYQNDKLYYAMEQVDITDFYNKRDLQTGREWDGIELSGGEWQRTALARAVYKHYGIIVFDEPTSAIDPISEAQIFDNMMKAAENRTAIFISHRLGCLKNMDRIIVLHNRIIKEAGTHSQLLGENGIYYNMWNSQMQGYMR